MAHLTPFKARLCRAFLIGVVEDVSRVETVKSMFSCRSGKPLV